MTKTLISSRTCRYCGADRAGMAHFCAKPLLTPAQAKALADAMSALNNVGASICDVFMETQDGHALIVRAVDCVEISDCLRTLERYKNQHDFFVAYGLT